MIKQVTLTTSEGKSFQANECDLSTNWVLVHNGTKVLNINENSGTKRGKLSTINHIIEADTKADLQAEAELLSLADFDKVLDAYEKRKTPTQLAPPAPSLAAPTN